MLLGIDLGTKNVGLAVSSGMIATPLKVVSVRNNQAICEIIKTIKQERIRTVVLGWPLSEDDSNNPKSQESIAFARKLREYGVKCEIFLVDEYLSTEEAKERPNNKGEKFIDAVAAAVILERFISKEFKITKFD